MIPIAAAQTMPFFTVTPAYVFAEVTVKNGRNPTGGQYRSGRFGQPN